MAICKELECLTDDGTNRDTEYYGEKKIDVNLSVVSVEDEGDWVGVRFWFSSINLDVPDYNLAPHLPRWVKVDH